MQTPTHQPHTDHISTRLWQIIRIPHSVTIDLLERCWWLNLRTNRERCWFRGVAPPSLTFRRCTAVSLSSERVTHKRPAFDPVDPGVVGVIAARESHGFVRRVLDEFTHEKFARASGDSGAKRSAIKTPACRGKESREATRSLTCRGTLGTS
eukprot:6122547-Pleurochrysis_carterae.AAC.4